MLFDSSHNKNNEYFNSYIRVSYVNEPSVIKEIIDKWLNLKKKLHYEYSFFKMEFFICYQIKVRYIFLSNFIPNQHELHNSPPNL
jgi:hypothetical protein